MKRRGVVRTVDAKRALRALQGVESLELLVPDMNGIPRGKRVPREEFRKVIERGINLPGATVLLDTQGCTIEIVPNGTLDGDPDMLCRLVPGSLV